MENISIIIIIFLMGLPALVAAFRYLYIAIKSKEVENKDPHENYKDMWN